MEPDRRSSIAAFFSHPAGITLAYLVVGILWIIFSDQLLLHLNLERQQFVQLQTMKGGIYVLTTAALIYFLVSRSWKHMHRANRELRTERGLTKSIFSGLTDVFYVFDLEGRMIRWNDRLREVTGYTNDEVRRMSPLDFTPRRYHRRIRAAIQQVFEEHHAVTVEAALVTSEGRNIPYEFTGAELENANGKVVGLVGIGRDVTNRKQREEALRAEKERFRLLVSEVKDYAIFMLDPEGRVVSWNLGAEHIMGYPEEEILGESISVLYPDGDGQQEGPEEFLKRARRLGRAEQEGWRLRADGSRFWAKVSLTVLYDEEGDLRGYAEVTQDMTEHREQERRFQAIFNQTYQFTGLLQPDGTFIEANETALRFGGLDREDVIGRPIWESHWFTVSDEMCQQLRHDVRHAASGEFVRHEMEVQGKDRRAIIDFSIKPVFDDAEEVVLLILEGRDITQRKRLEKENMEISRQERQWFAQELHDGVCQQLSNLSVMTATLQARLGDVSDDVDRRLKQINDLTERSIREARALSHGIAPVDFEDEDLCDVLEQLISEAETAHRINCCFEVDEAIAVSDPAAAMNLYRIAQEALSNAIRHGEAEEIRVVFGRSNDSLTLRIEDDGIGITDQPEGGMGLTTMRRRARMMDADLEIRGNQNGGTVVECRLPYEYETVTVGR